VPEGEPCPYCAHLAANPEDLRQHLLHLHPEAEPEPDWWDPDAVEPPLLLICGGTPGQRGIWVVDAAPLLLAGRGRPKPWVKVERPQQREDERP